MLTSPGSLYKSSCTKSLLVPFKPVSVEVLGANHVTAIFPAHTSPKRPIAIRFELVVDQHTTFRVQQHGKALFEGKFTIFRPHEEGQSTKAGSVAGPSNGPPQSAILMQVDGKYMSRDGRCSFTDASGLPLFELYHKIMGTTWHVELPGGNGKSIMRIAPRTCGLKDKLDGFVTYADGDGEEAVLRVGGQDIWKQRTNVTMGDKVVMTAKRTDKLSVYVPGRKLEWMVDVAAGMDMALASVIVVVLAANMYGSTSHESGY